MAVAFSAVGGGVTTGNATSPLTWPHTCGASDTDLLVYVTSSTGTTNQVTGVTYNGAAMTFLLYVPSGNAGPGGLAVYYLAAPPTGSAFTVSVAHAGSTWGWSVSTTGGGSHATAQSGFAAAPATAVSKSVPGTTTGGLIVAGACVGATQGGTMVATSGTMRGQVDGDNTSGANNIGVGTWTSAGGGAAQTVGFSGAGSDEWGLVAVEVLPGAAATVTGYVQPQRGGKSLRRRRPRPQQLVVPQPPPPNTNFTEAGQGTDSLSVPFSVAFTEAGSGSDAFSRGPRYIAGLGGTGAGYFVDQYGSPRMVWGDAVWGLCGNAGRWNSGNWQADYDTYLGNRAGQGFTVVYTKPMGTTQNGGINDDGRTFDGLFPFAGGTLANPSTGLTSSYWARIDYFLASAKAKGITVFLNAIGYDSDFETSGPLAGKSATEFQAYGAAIGARYAGQDNLVWMVADDYFGSVDSKISSFLTGLRGAGASQPISIENMPESTARWTLDPTQVALAWGTSNAQFNTVYSYDQEYLGVERAYAETSPITVIQLDGYFYQGNNTYAGGSGAFAYDRAFRQAAWWSLAAGARGKVHGSESMWQYQSTALAASSTDWWYANNAGNIRAAVEALPGWHQLVPDVGSGFITAGRGTRASAFASGGGGGQYEVAFTSSYVAASITPTGSLALLYIPNATTITIDQTKVGGAGNYTATWVDPVSGATSTATPGATYNTTAKGNNSQGDPDWVLVLQSTSTTTPVGLTDAGAGAAALSVSAPTALAEAGAGSDALAVSVVSAVALTDAGAGADVLGISPAVAVPLTDSGAGADALVVSAAVAVPLTDAGTGADALGLAAGVALTEAGAGTATAGILPGLAEAGAGGDAFTVTQPVGFTDAGAGGDALGALAGLGEAGAGADSLVVSQVAVIGLTDAGTGTDAVTILPVVPFIDAGAGNAALGVMAGLTDTGQGTDAVTVAAAAGLAEGGAGTDTLGVLAGLTEQGTAVDAFWPGTALAEAGQGADSLTVSLVALVSLTEAGSGTDTLTVTLATPVALTDAGTATDTLAPGITAGLADNGHGIDSIAVQALTAFTESGAGTEALTLAPAAVAFTEHGAGTDALVAIPPVTHYDLGELAAGAPRATWQAQAPQARYATGGARLRWAAGEPRT
jgi:hypothetical protein